MKNVTKILVLLLLAMPIKSFAVFKSKNDLLAAFAQAGFNQVISIPGRNGFSDIDVFNLDGNGPQVMSLNSAAKQTKSELRRPELDYISNDKAYIDHFIRGDRAAYAVQVYDVLLCYKSSLKAKAYIDCYVFPTSISTVVDALKAARKIK